MNDTILIKDGTAATRAAATPHVRELVADQTEHAMYLGDGVTPGGKRFSVTPAEQVNLEYGGSLPFPKQRLLAVPPCNDLMLGLSGTQLAAARTGKWLATLDVSGLGNPMVDLITSISSSDLVGVTGNLSIFGTCRLTTISFPALVTAGSLAIAQGSGTGSVSALTTVNFPSLVNTGSLVISGGSTSPTQLTNISFPSLVSVSGTFQVGAPNVVSISCPALVTIFGGGVQLLPQSAGNMNALTSVNYDSLTYMPNGLAAQTYLIGTGVNSLISLSLPSLAVVGGLSQFILVNGSAGALTSLQLPSLAVCNGPLALLGGPGFCDALTALSLPALTTLYGNLQISIPSVACGFKTLLLGNQLKNLNGDVSISANLDGHIAWAPSTRYPAYLTYTTPASSFTEAPGGTGNITASVAGHGLVAGDFVTISGVGTGNLPGTTHPANISRGMYLGTHNSAGFTVVDANTFTYNNVLTTNIPTGTATIQREAAVVFPVTRNGYKYICTTTGTSGSSEPVWPTTLGATVTDGTAVWTCMEASYENLIPKFVPLDGTNGTTLFGTNRAVSIAPISPTSCTLANATGGLCTITANGHGLTVGTQIAITGGTGTGLVYNGVWTVSNIVDVNSFKITVPAVLNGVVQAGSFKFSTSCPKFSGTIKVASAIVNTIADAHVLTGSTCLTDSPNGTSLYYQPVADYYSRNGSANGFSRYDGSRNGLSFWFDTVTRRWVLSPAASVGVAADVAKYAFTPEGFTFSGTPTGTTTTTLTAAYAHGGPSSAPTRFTVAITGCTGANATLNGTWTATASSATAFTIPVTNPASGTPNGTVTVLNRSYNQGLLLSSSVVAPVQAVLSTITSASHGYSNGAYVFFYGATGTDATSANDLFTSQSTNNMPSAITWIDANTFSVMRFATTQPTVGTLSLTAYPHIRSTTSADAAYYAALRLRARGVCATISGMNGI